MSLRFPLAANSLDSNEFVETTVKASSPDMTESMIRVSEIEVRTSPDNPEEVQARCSEKCAIKIPLIDGTALVDPSIVGNNELNNDGDCAQRHANNPEEVVQARCSVKCAIEIPLSDGTALVDPSVVRNNELNNDGDCAQRHANNPEEVQARCLMKCAIEIPLSDGTALVDPSVVGNLKVNNDGDGAQRHRTKPRRRGGKGRKNNNVILNCSYPVEYKEKKGLQYSRKEMEALRFVGLEEQKKRWVEVYCRLSPLVQQEYDKLDKTRKEDSVPSFDFDPRTQFQKSADLGEHCLQLADNHSDDVITSDPSSFLPVGDEIGCSAMEGECSEDDDSDEDYSSIQRPAFLVTGEPDFDSGPPQDGLEYLRRVRWEAVRIPKVKVVKINKSKEQSVYMPQIPDIMKCPENLLPLKQWEDSFLADFSELRLAFMRLDPQGSTSKGSIKHHQYVNEEDLVCQMLEGNTLEKFVSITPTDDCPALETSEDAEVNPHPPENSSSIVDPPTLSKILKMQSAARTSMLKKRIGSIENMSALPHNDSVWLFALCVAVDCPLDADTSAAFRSLLRKCASLRAGKEEVDDEVVILNILVTISGRYFGQLES